MAVRQYQPDPECAICQHPRRGEIDEELTYQDRGNICAPKSVQLRYGRETDIPTFELMHHWRCHLRAPEPPTGYHL